MKKIVIFIAFFMLLQANCYAVDYVDADNGNWSTSTVWEPAGVPGQGDTASIATYTITVPTGTNATIGGQGTQPGDVPLRKLSSEPLSSTFNIGTTNINSDNQIDKE